jgi:Zn-dependent oligopeptidase
MGTERQKPYADRTDIERIQSTWKKLGGLMNRKEWSAAVTRAATAAEIAANIAIRHELQELRKIEPEFVSHLLKWANGLAGKLDKLLKPLYRSHEQKERIKQLQKSAFRISEQRNDVVHSGAFMNEDEAKEVVELARGFAEILVKEYHPAFKLPL